MRYLRLIILPALAVMIAVLFGALYSSPISAASLSIQDGAEAAKGIDQVRDLFGQAGIFNTVTNVMLFVLGALSVIMILIGGLRYVVSGGNTSAITAAKNTILYAIVGLLVAIFAYAVVNFVITSFTPGSGGGFSGTDV